jgi:hypothetical protein
VSGPWHRFERSIHQTASLKAPFSTPHSPLSTLHSPLSTLHSPLSTLHSPLSTLHSPRSALHSPLSLYYCHYYYCLRLLVVTARSR